MYNYPIGVMLESFKLPVAESLKIARELGAKGIQAYVASPNSPHHPDNMNAAQRREFLDMVKSEGLIFSALCGDMGQGLYYADRNKKLVEKSKRFIDLAKDLETNVVTTHIGVIPDDPNHERFKVMQDACFQLAEYADSLDAHFAIETGPETSACLKQFLDSLHSKGVGVNLDPANLVMVTGDDPVQAVYNLKDYIVHTHAKDGVMNYYRNPEEVYGLLDVEKPKSKSFTEVPLGEGSVPFKGYIKALEDVGYRGFLTIVRECGEDRVKDITTAINFLRGIISEG